MTFTSFYDKSHEEIEEILIDTLHKYEDDARENAELLATDKRSQSLRNKGKEIGAALSAITNLIEDLGIEPEEL